MQIQRDAGLVRALGPLGLAASIVSMMIGAGILSAPGALAASVGPYAPLAFLACSLGIGAAAVRGANFAPQPGWHPEAVGRAVILAAFAFMGMEASLCNSGEVTRPTRTIPRALAIALASVTALYVAIQLIVQGILGPALAQSTAPLADAMGRISPALRVLMLAGTAFAMFGNIASDILGTPRVGFAFARDGLLPRALGRVHPITHTPHVAILSYAALAIVLALTGAFAELAVLATLAAAGLYIAACVAAWLLVRRGVALAGVPLNFRWLGPAMGLGVGTMLALIALGSPAEITALLALVAGSAAVYLLQSRILARSTT